MEQESNKSKRRPNREFPIYSLEESLKIAKTITDHNAGKPMNRLLLANAISRKPSSRQYRDLLSSSFSYGLTKGTEKADNIELTELGRKVTKPVSPQEEMIGKKTAAVTPMTFQRVYDYYKGNKWPTGKFFENTLEVQFNIPKEYVEEVNDLLLKNGKLANILRVISGSLFVMLDDVHPSTVSNNQESVDEFDKEIEDKIEEEGIGESQGGLDKNLSDEKITKPKPIFIAHGKNKTLLEQLKKILEQFKIPYKIAIDEAHSGRPISQKVRELMQECGSAIFIFSSEGEPKKEEEKSILNLNVVFELGAASVLYGDKIIIFKEEELDLPSDFSDIGHIPFEKNKLDSKTLELFKELVSMGFVKVIPT